MATPFLNLKTETPQKLIGGALRRQSAFGVSLASFYTLAVRSHSQIVFPVINLEG
ncbi:hypothetical protein Pse7429DRAFT_0951 [Pseudanabaena biceps PCC 7429]|uniref:Uncharacterized protein n=1 Tax=Pseudanabaena biceps PCC 7429 TaxID=927668 RepID=L8N4D1_9CYAN|nr:hypothetical protein Pse7429DRAFT_0951 [Pseudanabaena biceps PCC 7429]